MIQLHSQGADPVPEPPQTDEVPNPSNGDSNALTLQEVTDEDCFASAVAEAIGEADPSPSSPCMLIFILNKFHFFYIILLKILLAKIYSVSYKKEYYIIADL